MPPTCSAQHQGHVDCCRCSIHTGDDSFNGLAHIEIPRDRKLEIILRKGLGGVEVDSGEEVRWCITMPGSREQLYIVLCIVTHAVRAAVYIDLGRV